MLRKSSLRRIIRSVVAPLAAISLSALTLIQTAPAAVADTLPSDASLPSTVSTDPLPTTQVNGVVWAQAVYKGVVYAGGEFTKARPAGAAPGKNEVARSNFLSYDLETGQLRDWGPSFNRGVKDIEFSPDHKVMYVAGQFSAVDGVDRYRIAAFDTTTWKLLPWQPSINSTIYAIAVSDTEVFIGGAFTQVGNQKRDGAAAISRANASTITAFNPILAGGDPHALALSPDASKIVMGGNFTSTNKSNNPGYGLVIVNTATGATLPSAINSVVRNAGSSTGVTDLRGDETGFYGTAYSYTTRDFEGAFRGDWDGKLVWLADYHGDSYNVWPSPDGAVYTASHAHAAGNFGGFPQTNPVSYHYAHAFTRDVRGLNGREHLGIGYTNYEGKPAPELLNWFPDFVLGKYTGLSQAVWSVSGDENGDWVVFGGEFPEINGIAQQGLVRFAKSDVRKPASGPSASAKALRFMPFSQTSVQVSWAAAVDRDNFRLNYTLYRNGVRVKDAVADSNYFREGAASLIDTGLTAGQSYSYQVKVTDPDGNSAWSKQYTYTHKAGSSSVYDAFVLNDHPSSYWMLDDTGSSAVDVGVGHDGVIRSYVNKSAEGILPGSKAFQFRGASANSTVISTDKIYGPPQFSTEIWFKTTSSAGGVLMNFGSATSGTSASKDRMLWLSSAGKVNFGVRPGQARSVQSPNAYRDGKWHQAVGTMGRDGLKLYVDGKQVASLATTVNAWNLAGYWRIGGDSVSGYTPIPGTSYLAATLDSAAVYQYALTPEQVAAHYGVGTTGVVPNSAPEARFETTTNYVTVNVDGSPSFDSDGSVASYAWDFGDGAKATGAKASHTYARAGAYQVKLTVTDNTGATNSVTHRVVVAGKVSQPPTAVIKATLDGQKLSVDGSGSTDPDGSITGYAWNFGDGATATGSTATHTYAGVGSYVVTLTVTDNDGQTATEKRAVTIAGAAIKDTFTRAGTSWGTTDTGQAWTHTNGSYFSTAAGTGVVRLPVAASQGTALLNGVSVLDSDVTFSVKLDTATTGSGVQTTFVTRKNGNSDYRLTLQVHGNQTVRLNLTKMVNGVATNLGDVVANSVVYTQATTLNVRFTVQGLNTTTLTGKVWAKGTAEPATATISRQDETPQQLAVSGGVGFIAYLASNATTVPVEVRIDDLVVTPR